MVKVVFAKLWPRVLTLAKGLEALIPVKSVINFDARKSLSKGDIKDLFTFGICVKVTHPSLSHF